MLANLDVLDKNLKGKDGLDNNKNFNNKKDTAPEDNIDIPEDNFEENDEEKLKDVQNIKKKEVKEIILKVIIKIQV